MLYNLEKIFYNGDILVNGKKIIILKIIPIDIINIDEEYKQNLFSLYLTCIKRFDGEIQIYSSTSKDNFNDEIIKYKEKLNYVKTNNLKTAINKYIEYLVKISENETIYTTKYYIILNNKNEYTKEYILDIFKEFKDIGLKVIKIEKEEDLKQVLRASIVKEKNVCL